MTATEGQGSSPRLSASCGHDSGPHHSPGLQGVSSQRSVTARRPFVITASQHGLATPESTMFLKLHFSTAL